MMEYLQLQGQYSSSIRKTIVTQITTSTFEYHMNESVTLSLRVDWAEAGRKVYIQRFAVATWPVRNSGNEYAVHGAMPDSVSGAEAWARQQMLCAS